MNELQRLQEWYKSQCDEDWQHSFGVKIDTLDNPGWTVQIDLTDTALEEQIFESVSRGDSENDLDWLHCKTESCKFMAQGALATFLRF